MTCSHLDIGQDESSDIDAQQASSLIGNKIDKYEIGSFHFRFNDCQEKDIVQLERGNRHFQLAPLQLVVLDIQSFWQGDLVQSSY